MHYLPLFVASALTLTQPTENVETKEGIGCSEEAVIVERDSDSVRDFLRSARKRNRESGNYQDQEFSEELKAQE